VRSLLYDSPRFNHDDIIGILDSTQAVGYDQAGAMTRKVSEGILPIFSDSVSSEDVASSSNMMGGLPNTARARQMRCRWPPESNTPRSPIWVS
jgi:hypothetical protein